MVSYKNMKRARSIFKKLIHKHFVRTLFVVFIFLIVPISIVSAYIIFNNGKIYPGVYLGNTNVGGKNLSEATNELNKTLLNQNSSKVKFVGYSYNEGQQEKHEFSLAISEIQLNYEIQSNVLKAYSVGRSGNIINDLIEILGANFKVTIIPLSYSYDHQRFDEFFSIIASAMSFDPIPASLNYHDNKIEVNKGTKGMDINVSNIKEKTLDKFSNGNLTSAIEFSSYQTGKVLNQNEADIWESKASALKGKSVSVFRENFSKQYNDRDLISFLSYDNTNSKIEKEIDEISKNINREPVEPTLTVSRANNDTIKRVTSFTPSVDGMSVKTDELLAEFISKLNLLTSTDQSEAKIEIPVAKTSPKFNIGDVNNLGITTLIGKGYSKFRGSIPSRVHNVALAASRINGVLIAPGETFSFNQALGDVSKLTGYKEAYIIQDGKTVLGDGGGVCQVSTTLFRAVLDAGLPITERRGHSYRVTYYEQDSGVGLDATVFAPTTDFKFTNDTPTYILIQTSVNQKDMTAYFELYGTSDGRKSTVTKPVVYDQVPPPEDLFIDDPTLANGVIKQIDHKAWGAKSKFDYTVTRNGETIYQKTFLTVYKPWQAKFLRGTAL